MVSVNTLFKRIVLLRAD